jgi:Family of unknown function (DUF6502)
MGESESTKDAVKIGLTRLLPPMARWLLKGGVSVRETVDLMRTAYVLEAQKGMPEGIDLGKPNHSLVSERTGLSRTQIRKVLAGRQPNGELAARGGHRGQRVLTAWCTRREYRDRRGHPRILKISSGRWSFAEIVREYSGETQYRTMLMDLEQVGAVRVLPGDRVKLLRKNYAPVGWTCEGMTAMGEQLEEHIETWLHNLLYLEDGAKQLLCLRVSNSKVPKNFANIVARKVTDKVTSDFATVREIVTHPVHTASPLEDSETEQFSVTVYITRKPDAPSTPPKRARSRVPQKVD